MAYGISAASLIPLHPEHSQADVQADVDLEVYSLRNLQTGKNLEKAQRRKVLMPLCARRGCSVV